MRRGLRSIRRLRRTGFVLASAAWAAGLMMSVGHAAGQGGSTPEFVGPPAPKHERRELTAEQAEFEATRLRRESSKAFEQNRYADAERLLRELVPLEHDQPVHWYNLACAIALQVGTAPEAEREARADEAAGMLEQAVARGFANRVQLETDPDLASVRDRPKYRGILERWDRTVAAQSKARLDRLIKQYRAGERGSGYTLEQDDEHHLTIISGFEPRLMPLVREEFDRLSRWWDDIVEGAPAALDPTASDPAAHDPATRAPQSTAAAEKPVRPRVGVLLPTRADYREWAEAKFGERADRVGGAYMHEERLLVAMDLGATLRHEFWHVLHWRDMEARRQRHPIWVQEGLCSLVEDVEEGPDGAMIVKASWRTNMVRKMAQRGLLTPWDVLLGMKQDRFVRTRPLAMYAQGRAICMWLHERGQLGAWYRALVETYAEDPTGKRAFERVFNQPIDDIEKAFRSWARSLPEVQEEVGRGKANLPVSVEPGVGDGVVVAAVDLERMLRGKPRRAGGELRGGDVISAVASKPVRDLNDLARVLGDFEAGDAVTVDVRRGKRSLQVRVTLVPPQD